ncbi:hypothetical protein V502_00841, partial [Pseudogymnoascus sp. VKM F-4520 (FW-2644)]
MSDRASKVLAKGFLPGERGKSWECLVAMVGQQRSSASHTKQAYRQPYFGRALRPSYHSQYGYAASLATQECSLWHLPLIKDLYGKHLKTACNPLATSFSSLSFENALDNQPHAPSGTLTAEIRPSKLASIAMSGAEASFVVGLISGVISIIDATKTVYDAAKDAKGQPEAFRQVAARLPLVTEILHRAKAKTGALNETAQDPLEHILKSCKGKAEKLQEIFQKVIRKDDNKWYDRYKKALSTLGKGDKVETLMGEILKDVQVIACEKLEGTASSAQLKTLEEAIREMKEMPSSLTDEAGTVAQTHSGSGDNIGHSGSGSIYARDAHHNQNVGNVTYDYGSNATINNYTAPEDPLSRLPFATHAPFNSYERQHEPACLPNTRVDLLQDIYGWADGKDGQDGRCIFWLNGLAGTGKSTISRTIARRYNEQKRLGASFFFSKGGGDVSHAGMFFTTLAGQLAFTVPSLRHYICEAVREQSDIANLSLEDQWRHLVLGPLLRLEKSHQSDIANQSFFGRWRPHFLSPPSRLDKPHQSYILVVDALDECEGDNDVRKILELLAEARSLKTVRLRVFLTSRSEIPIRRGIRRIPQVENWDFTLQNIPLDVVNRDICLFLEYKLGTIRQDWSLAADWPGEVILRQLVHKSSGLFIWAATACRFINKGEEFAEDRLNKILEGTSFEGTPEQHLDQVYLTVLRSSIPNTLAAEEKVRLYARQREILGSIAILLFPLSTTSLAKVISISETQVTQTFERLQAILEVPNDNAGFLRLHHPSFRDFLLNKDRCGDFWVDEKEAHQKLAAGCIQLMSQTLKKDICEMHAPGSQVSEVESSWIEKCLPPEVQYACLYWIQHLQRGGFQVHGGEEAHRFLQAHLLHWLEALGWMGKISEGIQAILALEAHVPVHESPTLHAFIHDARRFAIYNRSVIEQAPIQSYCSALIFAAEKSIIRETFEKCIPTWIERKPRVQAHWSAALQTLEGHSDSVNSVAFSPDDKQVVSGSYDKT